MHRPLAPSLQVDEVLPAVCLLSNFTAIDVLHHQQTAWAAGDEVVNVAVQATPALPTPRRQARYRWTLAPWAPSNRAARVHAPCPGDGVRGRAEDARAARRASLDRARPIRSRGRRPRRRPPGGAHAVVPPHPRRREPAPVVLRGLLVSPQWSRRPCPRSGCGTRAPTRSRGSGVRWHGLSVWQDEDLVQLTIGWRAARIETAPVTPFRSRTITEIAPAVTHPRPTHPPPLDKRPSSASRQTSPWRRRMTLRLNLCSRHRGCHVAEHPGDERDADLFVINL